MTIFRRSVFLRGRLLAFPLIVLPLFSVGAEEAVLTGGNRAKFLTAPTARIAYARFLQDLALTGWPDPRCAGGPASLAARLHLRTSNGPTAAIPLPCAGWEGRGESFRYRASDLPEGEFLTVILRDGTLVARIKGGGFPGFDVPAAGVDWVEVRFAIGERGYCGRFDSFRRNGVVAPQTSIVDARGPSGPCAPLPTSTPTASPTVTTTFTVTPTPTVTATFTVTPSPTPSVMPEIRVDEPLHGSFVAPGTVAVRGAVMELPAGAYVTVNGVPIFNAPDGAWATAVNASGDAIVNPIAVEVRSEAGTPLARRRLAVVAGDSIPDGALSPMGVALRLRDSGLDAIEPVVTELVDLQPEQFLTPGTRLIDGRCVGRDPIFGSCLERVDVDLAGVSLASVAIELDATEDVVIGDVILHDVRVETNVDGNVTDCKITVTATTATIRGDYALSPSPLNPSEIDVNLAGSVQVSFGDFDDDTDCGGVLGSLVELVLPDVENLMRQGLEEFLRDPDGSGPLDAPIAAAFEEALRDVELAGPIGEGLGVNLETPLFDILADADGVTFDSDARITASMPDPGAPDLSASYHVGEAFPDFGMMTPVSGLPYDVAVCLSSSTFNQLLKAEVESGLLADDLHELDFGFGPLPITAQILALFVPEFATLDPQLPLAIRIRPTLAPIVTGRPGRRGELAEILIGQLELGIVSEAAGDEVLHLSLAVDFRTGFDLSLEEAAGKLVPDLAPPAVGDITVFVTSNSIGADEAMLRGTLTVVLRPLLSRLGDALGSIPLPSVVGLQLDGVEVSRNGQYLCVFADLS